MVEDFEDTREAAVPVTCELAAGVCEVKVDFLFTTMVVHEGNIFDDSVGARMNIVVAHLSCDDADVLTCLRSGEAWTREMLADVLAEMRRQADKQPRLVFARMLGAVALFRDLLTDAFGEHVCILATGPSLLRGEEDDGYAIYLCGGHGQTKGPPHVLTETQHVSGVGSWPAFPGTVRVTSFDYALPGDAENALRWPAVCVGRSQRQRVGDARRKRRRVAIAKAHAD